MNKIQILFLSLTLIMSSHVFSQNINGKATYKSVLQSNMKIDSSKVDDAQYMQMMKLINQAHYEEFELTFSGNESIYKVLPSLAKPEPSANGMTVSVSTMSEGEILYKNLDKNIELNETEIYGKRFLVSDTLGGIEWKLENESKKIGEYVCFKATASTMEDVFDGFSDNEIQNRKKEKTYVAWYTPQIPIKNGPAGYDGLPGLILEVRAGEMTYLCTKIVINPLEPIIIEAPTKGKKITDADFSAMLKKKNEEMMENFKSDRTIRE